MAKGGLGLQIPEDSAAAARLANLVNIADIVRDLDGDPAYLQAALDRALETYRSQRRLAEMLPPDPGRHLQRELTEPIMAQKAATLYSTLDTAGQRRLLSVASPHALQWTMGPNPWIRLTADEFRCALRWVTGTPMRPGEYRCPYCGKQADNMGVHAVSCTISGAAARGHYLVRDLHALLWQEAGLKVEKERSPLAHPNLRPADLLIHHLLPDGPTAMDFTLWTRLHDLYDELDQAVRNKRRVYKGPCEEEGWVFRAWGADTYGGLHPGARALTSMLAKHLADAGKYGEVEVSQLVWRAVLTAVIHRAAVQLARHVPPPPLDTEDDTVSEDEPGSEDDREGADTSGTAALGNDPNKPDRAAMDAHNRSPQQANLMEADEAAPEAVPQQQEPRPMEEDPGEVLRVRTISPTIQLGVALPSGSVLPVTTRQDVLVGTLKTQVVVACGFPAALASSFLLAWGHVCLVEDRTLQANDVQNRDVLTLVQRASTDPR